MTEHTLTEDQLRSFEEDGFLAIDNLLPADDLSEIEEEYALLLDRTAEFLRAQGRIPRLYAHLSFGDRYSAILNDYPDLHRHFNVSLPLQNEAITPENFLMHTGPAAFRLMRHPAILDVVQSVIGPEITCSPVQQMRMKPPQGNLSGGLTAHSNVGVTTWHQDIVALLPEADDTQQVTVWLAITEASIENGCLVSVPGSHRAGPRVHCSNRKLASEPSVPDRLMQEQEGVPLPVSKGGVVLFHKMNVHRALPNLSDGLRWSLDLRYLPTGQPTGRPAFPEFVARSRSDQHLELRDPDRWAMSWDDARDAILSGRYKGRIFEDARWADPAVC
ncbi:phytanoyl-CoA dioxygenase family protein [Roseibium sp. AS2]|uniref:phytanoyl-CoA dioxygenase family protein n=1 Tax=Roseibium sp. AS2 TaxID=3135781 RepID=UPI00317B6534